MLFLYLIITLYYLLGLIYFIYINIQNKNNQDTYSILHGDEELNF